MTTGTTERARSDIMHDIEGRHFGRCIDQIWGAGRRTLIELMDFPKAKTTVVVVKQYERAVPRSGSGKPWPDLEACYVYAPVADQTNTWEGLDAALSALEKKD